MSARRHGWAVGGGPGMGRRLWPAVLGGAGLAMMPAMGLAAAPGVSPRVGLHDGFTRIVFDVPAGLAEQVAQHDAQLELHLPGAGVVASIAAPRGLAGFAGGQDGAVLTLAPGCQPRVWHSAGRVVVDVFLPGSAGLAEAAPGVAARKPGQVVQTGAAELGRSASGGTQGVAPRGTGLGSAQPGKAGPGNAGHGNTDAGKHGGKQHAPAPAEKLEIKLVAMPDPAQPASDKPEAGAVAQSNAGPRGAPGGGGQTVPPAQQAAAGNATGAAPGGAALAAAARNGAGASSGSGTGAGNGAQAAPLPGPAQAAAGSAGFGPTAVAASPLASPDGSAIAAAPAANAAHGGSAAAGTLGGAGAEPDTVAVATDGLAVARLPNPPDGVVAALLLPFDPVVGAAAFRRGGRAHVVFDESKPLDLAALRDDHLFADAKVSLQTAATDLSLSLPAGAAMALKRRPEGWEVDITSASPQRDSARLSGKPGILNIAMADAAETLVLTDPGSGARLLVGTVHKPGQGVAVGHRSAEFRLCPSWAGVVVEAQSDRLDLHAERTGFALRMANGPALAAQLASTEQDLADAGALTRQLELTALPVPALLGHLQATLQEAALAPKLARFAPRLRAAQDLLALGLGREAVSVLHAALQDDPSQALNARAGSLLAAAEFLAGEQEDAAPGAPPRPMLSGSDEAALWRAIEGQGTESAPQNAATLAATWRLLLAYPAPLRARLMPVVADALLAGSQLEAAAALLAKEDDPRLDLERAQLLQLQNKPAEALALLDRLAAGLDRKQAAIANRRAVELRLAQHQIEPGAAAAALEQHLYAWREPKFELDTRLRIAALKSAAGQWREAIALLRETDTLFAEQHATIRAAERESIASLLRANGGAAMKPLDLVALVEENADLLAEKEASATIAPVLVDKLLALDLPDRAEPILARLMTQTAEPAPKGQLGVRLAALALDRGDTEAARADLAASASPELPPELVERRTVVAARIDAAAGKPDSALAALAPLRGAEALELRARLFEARKDWGGAEAALQALAEATLPQTGPLSTAQQELVLRLASSASQAGDMAAMQRLQGGLASRLDAGPRQDLFHALAAQPVSATTDLSRAGREAQTARAVPAALASFEPQPSR